MKTDGTKEQENGTGKRQDSKNASVNVATKDVQGDIYLLFTGEKTIIIIKRNQKVL